MTYSALRQTLERLAATRRAGPLTSGPGKFLSVGLETRAAGDVYYWNGLRRRGDAAHPFVIIQYTLEGWGTYQENETAWQVTVGKAFAALVPSAHVYSLTPDSPGWTFFWVMFNHPYVVERIGQIKAAVTRLEPESLTVARLMRLFEGVCQGGFRDEWAQEQALFEFLWEYERHTHNRRYAPPLREQLLADVRREIMERLSSTPDVACLGRSRGMSRSHFSHYFRDVTGLPPAQFVTQVRLEEVARRLLESNHTLETLAVDTGFADAKHLCKVFRRHYHLSPGAFRRQMRESVLFTVSSPTPKPALRERNGLK